MGKNLPLNADKGLPSSHLGITHLKCSKIKKALSFGKSDPKETSCHLQSNLFLYLLLPLDESSWWAEIRSESCTLGSDQSQLWWTAPLCWSLP